VGVMRKTESRIQQSFEGIFGRAFKGHVQPAEIAQKLVKEMEEGKVLSTSRAYVPHEYTVYLCRKDRDAFSRQEEVLVRELEGHLLQYARSEGYDLVGAPEVRITSDDSLKLGFFGIRTEPVRPGTTRSREARVPSATPPMPSAPASVPGAAALAALGSSDNTEGISAEQARELSLARRTLHLSDGRNRREFQQGRIVLGRTREADFRVDDPNVSRQHATLYWEGDQVFVKDLGSTNGTLINGRPVTVGPLVTGDVITLGNSKISVRIS
jgi:hypothetical protein